jgi:Cu-Zn family superoxide dismutase
MNRSLAHVFVGAAIAAVMPLAVAATSVTMNAIDANGVGKSLGTIVAEDGKDGLVLDIRLTGLPAGEHGFHVHENGDCGAKEKDGKMTAGLAAGGHYDPHKTGKHAGPKGAGHLGDLPVLSAGKDGKITAKAVAPRLKLADIKGRSLMLHEGADNYSDDPKPLGGGGARIACGVVK